MMRIIKDIKFFGIKGLGECLLIPTICVYYTKYYFFETGVYTPMFILGIKFLKCEIGMQYHKDPYNK